MKIQCPECNKVYNLDDKMIPDAGVKVKCKCETKFFIKKDSVKAEEEPIIHEESKAEEKCPNCSHNRSSQDLECPSCGIIYEKYKEKPKIQEEPKPEEEFKAEEVLRLKEALKKAEEALKAADGKQKTGENPNKKTLKYPILAVTISICLMFGTYFLLTSRPIQIAKLESEPIKSEQPKAEPVKSNQKYIDAYEYLKRIEAYYESGVTIVNIDNAIAEARFRINLVANCPEKNDFLYVLSIFNILRDAWYYDKINFDVAMLFQTAIKSTELYEPLQKLWDDRLSKLKGKKREQYEYLGDYASALRYSDAIREKYDVSKEYFNDAKPILFARVNEILSKLIPNQ